jgi:transitional endoplasmic reticulum ATPase
MSPSQILGLNLTDLIYFYQNMQQSRGFGNNFKFPEGEGGTSTAGTASGNAGFTEDAADDDLYA